MKKSKWVRFRTFCFLPFIFLGRAVRDFVKDFYNVVLKDANIRKIFNSIKDEILQGALALNKEDIPGAKKRDALRKLIETTLKEKGLEMKGYLQNLLVEMAVAYMRKLLDKD